MLKKKKNVGINVRKGGISNILEELVVQLMYLRALTLSTETVHSILKIDDAVNAR